MIIRNHPVDRALSRLVWPVVRELETIEAGGRINEDVVVADAGWKWLILTVVQKNATRTFMAMG